MPSGKLSYKQTGLHAWFNPTLCRKNITRFWPIWAAYAAVLFFSLPLQLLTNYGTEAAGTFTLSFGRELPNVTISGTEYFARVFVPQITVSFTWIIGLFMGVLAAMAVFSYLFQARSVGLMHALPVKRETLFFTNYLSGLSFFALPLLFNFFVTLIAEAAMGEVFFPALFSWLVVSLLTTFFFFSFAVFCAMFTGHILALPAFYAILNGLAAGIYSVLSEVFQEFIYGYVSHSGGGLEEMMRWLSPGVYLLLRLSTAPADNSYCVSGLFPVFVYALAGLILTACSMALYHKRQLETAGDVVSVSWVRPVFRYGVAVCAALVPGMLLYKLVNGGVAPQPWIFLICAILCGVVGYYAADMLLRKSFRVFRKNWRGPAIVSAALAAGMLCLVFDVTGFVHRIPKAEDVASVSVWSYNTTYPEDSWRLPNLNFDNLEDIAFVQQLHAAILSERADTSNHVVYDDYADVSYGGAALSIGTQSYKELMLNYILKDGKYFSRNYTVLVNEERLSDPNSAAGLLNTLVNRPDNVDSAYFQEVNEFLEEGYEVRLTDVNVTMQDEDALPLDLDQAGRDALLEAVRADIAAGRLGKRYLLENEERYTNCYYNDLRLTFYSDGYQKRYVNRNGYFDITITLQATAEQTLAAVEAGGLDPAKLITLAELYTTADDEAYREDTVYAEEYIG